MRVRGTLDHRFALLLQASQTLTRDIILARCNVEEVDGVRAI